MDFPALHAETVSNPSIVVHVSGLFIASMLRGGARDAKRARRNARKRARRVWARFRVARRSALRDAVEVWPAIRAEPERGAMTYRSHEDAARDRRNSLEDELRTLRDRQADARVHDAEVERVTSELRKNRDVLDRIQKNRTLPMLESIRIATPCSARWEEMKGDDRSRHCSHCDKHVFNLSAMTREEAELTMLEKTGEVCVRLFRRADGTVLTEDCPVGVRRRRLRLFGVVTLAAGLAAAAAGSALSNLQVGQRPAGATMGLALRADPEAIAPVLEKAREVIAGAKK